MNSNDVKGLCLFLGLLGLGYVALVIIAALLTGAKIIQSILLISIFSTFLISLGLTPQVKKRLANYLKSLSYRQFV